MAKYRDSLPQLGERLFLMDGGLETTLIFHHGIELPHFAAFQLLRDEASHPALRGYFDAYIDIAKEAGAGLILESATWRANADWGALLGYDAEALADANRRAISMLEDIRAEHEDEALPMVISGCMGPRGDGYRADHAMSTREAEAYHGRQIAVFAETAADMLAAITLNYPEEAIGITRAAKAADMPVAIAFTVETDGRLPNGLGLGEAIQQVEESTDGYPIYYLVNCAHPTHFSHVLTPGEGWVGRIRGLRANASRKSHAELDESTELDIGDPEEFGRLYAALRERLPQLTVLGGCCGTDHRHLGAVARACRRC